MTRATLEVDRRELTEAGVAVEAVPEPRDGEAVLAVERFGLTANVITYATVGDDLGYWRFFPVNRPGWGRIPAWGYAEVVASASDALRDGDRLFGLVPMSSHVVLTPRASAAGITDVTPHRTKLPGAYNAYRVAGHGAAADDDRELVLRPLFLLCFLLADLLVQQALFGAKQVLLTSASSKTALGLAQQLSEKGVRVVGITSARNADFVRGVGVYEDVVVYGEIALLDATVASVVVDLSGASELRRRVHEHFGGALCHSALVGATHGRPDAFAADPRLPGPLQPCSSSPTACGPARGIGGKPTSTPASTPPSRTSPGGPRAG